MSARRHVSGYAIDFKGRQLYAPTTTQTRTAIDRRRHTVAQTDQRTSDCLVDKSNAGRQSPTTASFTRADESGHDPVLHVVTNDASLASTNEYPRCSVVLPTRSSEYPMLFRDIEPTSFGEDPVICPTVALVSIEVPVGVESRIQSIALDDCVKCAVVRVGAVRSAVSAATTMVTHTVHTGATRVSPRIMLGTSPNAGDAVLQWQQRCRRGGCPCWLRSSGANLTRISRNFTRARCHSCSLTRS